VLAGGHVKATAAIDAAIEQGLTALQRLDTIARNKLREDTLTLAAWERACHVERAGRAKANTAGAATTAPPQPASWKTADIAGISEDEMRQFMPHFISARVKPSQNT
jgi:hypothetical protein